MSCGKIDDLEDLAADLFEFEGEEDSKNKPVREKVLKRQQKKEKIKQKQEAKI